MCECVCVYVWVCMCVCMYLCMCLFVCVAWFFFASDCFGSNQKITTKLLACHEICLEFFLFLFDFFFFLRCWCKTFCYFTFVLPPVPPHIPPQPLCQTECKVFMCFAIFFLQLLLTSFFFVYNLKLQSVGRLPLCEAIAPQWGRVTVKAGKWYAVNAC